MRAAIFREYGGADVLHLDDVPDPAAGPGEIRVAVQAAALNHLDVWTRRGLPDHTLPHIGGSDIAGIVDALGAGVTSLATGTRVVVNPTVSCGTCEWCVRGEDSLCTTFRIIGEHLQGGFAEYVVVPAANLLALPAGFDVERAAAAPLAFLTAWRGLVSRARLQSGESVLITGASGGVATAAIALARHFGARVFAITTTDHVDQVRALGADHVFDRNEPAHRKQLFDATGRRGVDVVFDSVGAATWHDNLRALSRGGRLVVYGATTGHAASTDLRFIFWKQLDIMGTTMSNRREFADVMRLVFDGAVAPVIDVVWPLDRIRDAHLRLERGEQFGKIVLVP